MPSAAQKTVTLLLAILLFVGGCVAPGLEPAQTQPLSTETPKPDAFSSQLRQAVESGDSDAMRGLMDDSLFVIAFWPGNSLPPLPGDDAIGQLRSLHMTGGPIRFPEPDAPLSEMLGGQDPVHIFQSDVPVVSTSRNLAILGCCGWGRAAKQIFPRNKVSDWAVS
jgi:hypothetical protein